MYIIISGLNILDFIMANVTNQQSLLLVNISSYTIIYIFIDV